MTYTNVINHTRAGLKFVIGDKEYEVGSKGNFNINHDYDYSVDKNTLRIVEDDIVIAVASAMGYSNFISLKDLIAGSFNLAVISNVCSKIYITTGIGGIVRTCYSTDDTSVEVMFANKKLHMIDESLFDSIYTIDTAEFDIVTNLTFKDYVC